MHMIAIHTLFFASTLVSIISTSNQLVRAFSAPRTIGTTTTTTLLFMTTKPPPPTTASLIMASEQNAVSNTLPPPLPVDAKRIFFVRHGEVINPGGPDRTVFYGGQDVPLSPLGEREAQAAAIYLQQFPISLVFSSPLQRAIYGAQQVWEYQRAAATAAAAADVESNTSGGGPRADGVIQLKGFTELDRGAWAGLTKEEIGVDNLARFDACDETVTPADGESYPQLKARVLQARDEVLRMLQPGEIGCVVSHLQVTRSILSDALGIPTSEMSRIKVATASVTCIDYHGDDSDPPQIVHFQSFKPDAGLEEAKDGAN